MGSFPKLIALDLDNTLWKGHLDKDMFQKRADPNSVIEDNLVCTDGRTVHDVKGKCSITFATDAPSIINIIRSRDAKIAVVSRNTSKALCDRAMWMLKVTVKDKKEPVPFTDLIQYDEVRDEVKEIPFHRIQGWSEFEYHEMLFFDDEHRNATVETNLGITFQHVSFETGITNDIFNAGLKVWRRNQALRVPLPRSPSKNQECLLVGYLGTDLKTAKLYEEGKRRPKSDRPSRWGWGMYLTDKPKIALFFAHWRREKQKAGDERICCIYARNGPKFLHELQKVWIAEDGKYMTNNLDANVQDLDKYIMERESYRDEYVKSAYKIEKPYVLFSKHHHMAGMEDFDLPINQSFNELVIYPQIQDALFVGEAYKPNEVQVGGWPDLEYDKKITSWNIKNNK